MGESLRRVAAKRFSDVLRMVEHRITKRQRESVVFQQILADIYIHGFVDGNHYVPPDPNAKPQRIMPVPHVRTRAVVTSYASNTPGKSLYTGNYPSTGEYIPVQLPLEITISGGMGGVGGKATTALICPPELIAFDAAMRRCARYRPTQRFYDELMTYYVNIPGLDLLYQAEKMLRWLRDTPKGRSRKNIPDTAENWLANAKDTAVKKQRGSSPQHRNGANGSGRAYGMGGTVSAEARRGAENYQRRAEQARLDDDGDDDGRT